MQNEIVSYDTLADTAIFTEILTTCGRKQTFLTISQLRKRQIRITVVARLLHIVGDCYH